MSHFFEYIIIIFTPLSVKITAFFCPKTICRSL
nr:MAG TPA_asm: hypothetical protein [Caudoviricetes sp.]